MIGRTTARASADADEAPTAEWKHVLQTREAVTSDVSVKAAVMRALAGNRSVHVDAITVKVSNGERDSARGVESPIQPGGGAHSLRGHGRASGSTIS